MIKRFRNWLRDTLFKNKVKKVAYNKRKNSLELVYLHDEPEILVPGIAYLIGANNNYWQISLKCPCGCTDNIHLNLLGESYPYWKVLYPYDLLNVYPSIKRTKGCKSHFYIKHGVIEWFNDFEWDEA